MALLMNSQSIMLAEVPSKTAYSRYALRGDEQRDRNGNRF